jgi:hypothetical protein
MNYALFFFNYYSWLQLGTFNVHICVSNSRFKYLFICGFFFHYHHSKDEMSLA